MQTDTLLENSFNGLDASTPPELLPPGFLTQCDDAVFVGHLGDGGHLQTRPGMQGVWSAAIATNKYIAAGTTFRDANDDQYYVFVAGATATSSNGVLYYWKKGDSSPTLATNSTGVTWKCDKVQLIRGNDYVFICGGASDGKVYRYIPAGSVEGITGATTPSYTVSDSLTNNQVVSFSNAGSLVNDTLSASTITVSNSKFAGGKPQGSGVTNNIFDDQTGGSSVWYVNNSPTGVELATNQTLTTTTGTAYSSGNQSTGGWVRLDATGDNIITKTGSEYSNVTVFTPTTGESVTRYATHFRVNFQYIASFATNAVTVTLYACDSGGTVKASVPAQFTTATTGSAVLASVYFSFANIIADTVPVKLKVGFQNSGSGAGGSTNGPYITEVDIVPVAPPTPILSNSGVQFFAHGATVYPGSYARIGNQHISYNYFVAVGSTLNFSNYTQIAISYSPLIQGLQTPRIRMRFRNTYNGNYVDTAELTPYIDSTGRQYLTANLSGLSDNLGGSSSTILGAIKIIDFYAVDDVPLPGVSANGQAVFQIGPIFNAGNLTPNLTYTYAIREKAASTNYLSQAIYASPGLTPTQVQATSQLNFSATPPVNAGATTEVWRSGGTFTDGLYRKVAEISSGGSLAYGSSYCTYASKALTDSTPDTALIGAITMVDHTAPDFGGTWGYAVSVAVFAQRLAVITQPNSGTGNSSIYLSQVNTGGEFGLYWDTVNDITSANLINQGYYRRISGNENASSGQSAVRIIPFQQSLIVLFKDMLAILRGSYPGNFELVRYAGTTQRGAINANACMVFGNLLYFLSEDGLRTWDGDQIGKASQLIDRALNPQATLTGAPIDKAAYSQSSLFSHADRLYLGAPFTASDSATAGIYVVDQTAGGRWLRWKKTGVTGGFTFSSASDQNDFYVTGGLNDGMIYKVTGGAYGDKATSNASETAVTMSVATRWLAPFPYEVRGERMGFACESSGASPSLTLTAIADGDTSNQTQVVYTGNAGNNDIGRQKIKPCTKGRYIALAFSATPGTATNFCTLRRLQLMITVNRQI